MAPPTLKLVVERGPSSGREVALAGRPLTIGRAASADLVLISDDFVSPQHARVTWSDHGPVLKNDSPNGTLVNGKSISETVLAPGDKISIGLMHLLAVRGTVGVHRPAAAAGGRPAGPAPAAPPAPARRRVPSWVLAYLVLMAGVFLFFTAMRLRGSGEAGLVEIRAAEQQYAASRRLPAAQTARVIRLLEAAAVHERRGDRSSAYEVYREVLSARVPLQPRSPAYVFAAGRAAALGGRRR